MSIKAMNWVWDQHTRLAAEKLILLALADHANQNNEAWPGIELLADKCCMTERNVRKILSELVTSGRISLQHRREKGRQITNMYRLNTHRTFTKPPKTAGTTVPPVSKPKKTKTPPTAGTTVPPEKPNTAGTTVPNTAGTTVHPNHQTATINKNITPLSISQKDREKDGGGKEEVKQEDFELTPLHVVQPNTASLIEAVFSDWQTTLDYPRHRLGEERRKAIAKALDIGYTRDELADAFMGCKRSSHHQGHNMRGTRYDSLLLILRNSENIDRFRSYRDKPPAPRWRSDEHPSAKLAADARRHWQNACIDAEREAAAGPHHTGDYIDHDSGQAVNYSKRT